MLYKCQFVYGENLFFFSAMFANFISHEVSKEAFYCLYLYLKIDSIMYFEQNIIDY